VKLNRTVRETVPESIIHVSKHVLCSTQTINMLPNIPLYLVSFRLVSRILFFNDSCMPPISIGTNAKLILLNLTSFFMKIPLEIGIGFFKES